MSGEMSKSPDSTRLTFKPRHSSGWIWLIGFALLGLVLLIPIVQSAAQIPLLLLLVTTGPTGLFVVCGVALALWFPTMRYDLDERELILHYGPVLNYRIPLAQIESIRRRDLGMTIWSSIRFPGIALFTVPYADVGNVKMCATGALKDILLIETSRAKYGITPADESGLVAAIRSRIEG